MLRNTPLAPPRQDAPRAAAGADENAEPTCRGKRDDPVAATQLNARLEREVRAQPDR